MALAGSCSSPAADAPAAPGGDPPAAPAAQPPAAPATQHPAAPGGDPPAAPATQPTGAAPTQQGKPGGSSTFGPDDDGSGHQVVNPLVPNPGPRGHTLNAVMEKASVGTHVEELLYK